MVVFGGSGGFAAISSPFYIVHTYESQYTKGEPWNYPMKAAAKTFQK